MSLDEAASHHAVRVLRLRAGEAVELFNGDGRGYRGTLTQLDPRSATVTLDSVTDAQALARPTLELLQGLAANDRMDWVIEKAVELGVHRLQPLIARRSVVRYDPERARRREEHWRRIVVAACMQCGRNRLPEIGTLKALLPGLEPGCDTEAGSGTRSGAQSATSPEPPLRLILLPEASTPVGSLPLETKDPPAHIQILVGPEGGFDPQEIQAAIALGWQAVRLGSWVLRTETAGLAMLAALQTRLGLWS